MLGAVEQFVKGQRPGGFPEIRFVGGGAKSAFWCQVFADVLGRRILQVKDPVLANARGAAMAASVALGHGTFETLADHVQIERAHEPDPARRALYDRSFAAFLEAYRGVKGLRLAEEKP